VNNLAVQSLVAAYGEKKAIVDESSARIGGGGRSPLSDADSLNTAPTR